MFFLLLVGYSLVPMTPVPQEASGDVVVYGTRLDAAHGECVAKRCSVLRDAQVAIALAEQQLRAGAYLAAKGTLAAALNRTKDQAATFPKPVSALYEAYAAVSLQEGDIETYRAAVAREVRTLRDNLPATDPAVTAAAFATGDMWLELNEPLRADASYAAAEKNAQDIGDRRGVLVATLRRVALAANQGETRRAKEMLKTVAADPAAADPAVQTLIRVVALRAAARGSDTATVDRLVADIGHQSGAQPHLIWQPEYPVDPDLAARQVATKFGYADATTTRSSDRGAIQWADIGFWIAPDGRTREAAVLRGSSGYGWTHPLLLQVAGRRYSESAAGSPGVYRIERFSSRPIYTVPIGSLIRRRAGPVSLQVLDLTDPSATPITLR